MQPCLPECNHLKSGCVATLSAYDQYLVQARSKCQQSLLFIYLFMFSRIMKLSCINERKTRNEWQFFNIYHVNMPYVSKHPCWTMNDFQFLIQVRILYIPWGWHIALRPSRRAIFSTSSTPPLTLPTSGKKH